jgi:hypothetical protein
MEACSHSSIHGHTLTHELNHKRVHAGIVSLTQACSQEMREGGVTGPSHLSSYSAAYEQLRCSVMVDTQLLFGYLYSNYLATAVKPFSSCASSNGNQCKSLRNGVKQRQINWAPELLHLFGIVRAPAQGQVTCSPAPGDLYSSVKPQPYCR